MGSHGLFASGQMDLQSELHAGPSGRALESSGRGKKWLFPSQGIFVGNPDEETPAYWQCPTAFRDPLSDQKLVGIHVWRPYQTPGATRDLRRALLLVRRSSTSELAKSFAPRPSNSAPREFGPHRIRQRKKPRSPLEDLTKRGASAKSRAFAPERLGIHRGSRHHGYL